MNYIEQNIFEVISAAGESKGNSMKAIDYANDGKEDEAKKYLLKATNSLKKGNKAHFKLITGKEAEKINFSVLLIHAEDQLMAAETFRDLATKLVETDLKLAKLTSK